MPVNLNDSRINIVPQAPADNGINILPTDVQPILDPKVAAQRADQFDYSMGVHSPGKEDLYGAISTGTENLIRQQFVYQKALEEHQTQTEKIRQVASDAANEGRSLTPQDIQDAYFSDDNYHNPDTVIERSGAKKLTGEVLRDDPQAGRVQDILTTRDALQTLNQNYAQKYKEQSWTDWGIDFAKLQIPFYSTYKLHDAVADLSGSGILQGDNLAAQIQYLYSLPPQEAVMKASEAANHLAQSNLQLAVEFTNAVANGMSQKDIQGKDLGTALDALSLGAATPLAKIGTKTEKLLKPAQDLVDAHTSTGITSTDRAVLRGDSTAGAIEGAQKEINAVTTQADNLTQDYGKNHFGLADPKFYDRGPSTLTNEQKRDILDQLSRNKDILEYTLNPGQHVVRLTDEQFNQAAAETVRRELSSRFNGFDHVVDMVPQRVNPDKWWEPDNIEVLMGQKDGSAFGSAQKAQAYAQDWLGMKPGEFGVTSRGNSYYIQKILPVAEDGTYKPITTDNNDPRTLQSIFFGLLSNIRSPDDVVSVLSRMQRKTATYGMQQTLANMGEVAKSIGALGKNESQRLRQIMDEGLTQKRQVIDPLTGKKVWVNGKFYDSFGEFETAYMKRHNLQPSNKETQAYFSFRQLMDEDLKYRNLSMYRDLSRLGFNYKRISMTGVDKAGKKINQESGYFIGRTRENIPWSDKKPFTVAWNNPKTGKMQFKLSSSLFKGERDEIEKQLKAGASIVEPESPWHPELKKMIRSGGEPINYVITHKPNDKPLDYNLIAANEGGHHIYPTKGGYAKQAQIKTSMFNRRIYTGDTTLFYFPKGKTGKTMVDLVNKARVAMNNGATDSQLDQMLIKVADWDGKKFRGMFRTRPDGEEPLDPHEPIVYTDHGQRALDVRPAEDVVDMANSIHSPGSQINRQYTQERGERLIAVANHGTEVNPLYKFHPAPLLDSYQAMNRMMFDTSKNLYLEDLKHSQIQEWVKKYAEALDMPVDQALANPVQALRDAAFKTDYANRALVSYGQAERRALLRFLNYGHDDYKWGDYFRQKIIDSIFNDKQILTDPWKWDRLANPVSILRSMVFHSTLGVFNWTQMPKQLQGLIYMTAVDGNPQRVSKAMSMYSAARFRNLSSNAAANESILKALEKIGIDRQTFLNAEAAWKNSGMNGVEGIHANMDYYLKPPMIRGQNGLARGLDAGLVFFREGNNAHLGSSFFTSYLRYLDENGLKKLNAQDFMKIKDRADLYYGNMSRASSNPLISDPALGTLTMFTTYQTRLAEALLGKRLSTAEKARVLGMYSVLYGVPVGVIGSTVPIWPWRDQFKQWQIEGSNGGDADTFETLLNDGLPAYLSGLFGHQMDVASSYGPNGFTNLRDFWDGLNGTSEDGIWKAITGPQGSFVERVMTAFEPFKMKLLSVFNGDSWQYPLNQSDFLDAARVIGTVDRAAQLYYIWSTGQYLTSSGKTMMQGDPHDFWNTAAASLGIRPQELEDMSVKARSVNLSKASKQVVSKAARDQFEMGLKYANQNDAKMAEEYFKRANALLSNGMFNPIEQAAIAKDAFTDNKTLIDKVDQNFMKQAPENRYMNYLNTRGNN